jgi:hypothetical protein
MAREALRRLNDLKEMIVWFREQGIWLEVVHAKDSYDVSLRKAS